MKKLYAVIRRGKREGEEIEVSQWCNDWFSLADGSIVSPVMLVFTNAGMDLIRSHNNNGMLFGWFETRSINLNLYNKRKGYRDQYAVGFKRRKL